ncbi:MAG: ABC transporter permease subunit [Gemmataceae bacterium]|nr:ABC transporter permease subunit [Gemmataceae bacterium]MCI0743240.1 ABC transporter permease subunit [Gemmataceae bacterium]
MSTNLLHYRTWQGKFRRPLWAVWPICRVALGMLFRRKLFWFLYATGLLLFLMFFFGTYLLDWAETMLPTQPIRVGKVSAEPERIMRVLRQGLRVLNGSQETFMYFFIYQGTMVVVVLTLAGATLVGNDFTEHSLVFYLAKPISRWHYVAGKCLAASVVVHMLTTLPAIILFIQHGMEDFDYFLNPDYFVESNTGRGPASWPLLWGILQYGIFLSVVLSLILVATASWVRRTMPMIMLWLSLFIFLRLLAGILVDGLQYGVRWRLLDLWNDLCIVGSRFLGFEQYTMGPGGPDRQPAFWEASLVLAGVCALCLMFLSRLTRGVEVVR